MTNKEELISVSDAKKQVELAVRRLALLHLAFAETLEQELGKEQGKRLTVKAIENYSRRIGERKRELAKKQGLEPIPANASRLRDFPSIGVLERMEQVEVDGEKRARGWGCVMSQVWRQCGRSDLGRIYCYADPASTMALNPDLKMIHTRTVPDGDDFCELVWRSTTEEERRDFAAGRANWTAIDRG